MTQGIVARRGVGRRGEGDAAWTARAFGVFGTEVAPLTQDADSLPVALLAPGGGRASQRPPAPPQLPPDEPVEDAEAQKGQEEVGGGDPQHDAQRAQLRWVRPALTTEQRRGSRGLGGLGPRRRRQRWRPRRPEGRRWRPGAGRGGARRAAVKVRDRGDAGVLLDAHQKEEGPCGEQRHRPERSDECADAAPGDEDAGAERAADGEVALDAERRHVQQRGVGAALAHVKREAAEQLPEHPGPRAPEAVQVEGEPEQDEQVGYGHAAQVQVGGGPHVPVAPDQQHRHHVAAHPDGEQTQAHGGHRHQRPQGEGRAEALVARQQRALRAVAAVPGAAHGRAAPADARPRSAPLRAAAPPAGRGGRAQGPAGEALPRAARAQRLAGPCPHWPSSAAPRVGTRVCRVCFEALWSGRCAVSAPGHRPPHSRPTPALSLWSVACQGASLAAAGTREAAAAHESCPVQGRTEPRRGGLLSSAERGRFGRSSGEGDFLRDLG